MKVGLSILFCVGCERESCRLIGMKLNFVELDNFNAIFICMNID